MVTAAMVRMAMMASKGQVSHWLILWIQWYPYSAITAAMLALMK